MPSYKEMYFKLFRASVQAINILIAAQRECEEHYISSPQPEFWAELTAAGNQKSMDEE